MTKEYQQLILDDIVLMNIALKTVLYEIDDDALSVGVDPAIKEETLKQIMDGKKPDFSRVSFNENLIKVQYSMYSHYLPSNLSVSNLNNEFLLKYYNLSFNLKIKQDVIDYFKKINEMRSKGESNGEKPEICFSVVENEKYSDEIYCIVNKVRISFKKDISAIGDGDLICDLYAVENGKDIIKIRSDIELHYSKFIGLEI